MARWLLLIGVREESGGPPAGLGIMTKKDDTNKVSFLFPNSKRVVTGEEGVTRDSGDGENVAEIQDMESNIDRLQSIHDRLQSLISEMEDFSKKKS